VYEQRIFHEGLKAYRVIRGATSYDVDEKAKAQAAAWNDRWSRIQDAQARKRAKEMQVSKTYQQKEWALERTKAAEAEVQALSSVLSDSIEVDHAIDWESLKDNTLFPTPRPQKPSPDTLPPEPYRIPTPEVRLTCWQRLIPPLRTSVERSIQEKREDANRQYERMLSEWRNAVNKVDLRNKGFKQSHEAELAKWESCKLAYQEDQRRKATEIDEKHSKYLKQDPVALNDYWDMVLRQSEYPDDFPRSFAFDYISDTKTLVVEYSLPNMTALPSVKEVKFVASRGEFQEVHLSAAWLSRTYDLVLYQIALRTIYELLQSDAVAALDSVVFNGWVDSVEKASGKEVNACVISIQANKAEFMEINLSQVDPKACFKKLKGVSGSKLSDLSPIRPVLQLNKDDKRFVSSYGVVDDLDDSYNLAAMDWLDFENLIREVFEKEFSLGGGEVKITRASRDGGVDAVAFDPDPIRGGKIVIQAKRYTNTVSVSAVRDLYGTVLNEGATKGILVTTADYGPDAYEFAKGKPLTLLSGSENKRKRRIPELYNQAIRILRTSRADTMRS